MNQHLEFFKSNGGIRAGSGFRELWNMMRRGKLSSQAGKSPIQELQKIEVVVTSLELNEMNYRHWSMKMEVHLDAQGL